jgi:formyltetrahydrofolate deformylase
VHTVTGWLASRSYDIRDSAQYGDPQTNTFFMRVHALGPEGREVDVAGLREEFGRDVAGRMGGDKMKWEMEEEDKKIKVMLMVSKIGRE